MPSKIGTREALLIRVLDKKVQGQFNEYGVTQIREWLALEMDEQPAWLSNGWVGFALRRLGLTDKRQSRHKGERNLYLIPRSCVEILKKVTS